MIAPPTERDGFSAWRLLEEAVRSTGLLPLEDEPFGAPGGASGSAAASAQHRTFQIVPGRKTYMGRMRPEEDQDEAERDIIEEQRTVTVQLFHDLDPHSHAASYQLADKDLEAVEDALMTHPAANWLGPILESTDVARQGHVIVHTIVFTVHYERLLPPIPPPTQE